MVFKSWHKVSIQFFLGLPGLRLTWWSICQYMTCSTVLGVYFTVLLYTMICDAWVAVCQPFVKLYDDDDDDDDDDDNDKLAVGL